MWLEIHERHLAALREAEDPQVVFAGDSLTDAWQYQPSWVSPLGRFRPVNLGIGGDRTQHLLWRLQHHLLPPVPLYAVLIGTNNILRNRPEEIVDGIRACCAEITRQSPGSKILLQKLLPRQKSPAESAYQQVLEVNRRMDALCDGSTIVAADFSELFLSSGGGEGHLHPERMQPDHVHITEAGYAAWAEAILPQIETLL